MSPTAPTDDNGRWQVKVDSGRCIGSGMCISIDPKHFRFVDGRAQPVQEGVDPDYLVLDAGDACPVEAILVRDKSTGDLLAPTN